MRLLTAPGLSGVAVVGFAATERAAVLASLRTPSGQPFVFAASARPRLASLWVDGQVVDQVLAVDRGDRGIELHLHGSPAVIEAMRAAFPTVEAEADSATAADRLLRSALSVEQLDLALEQRDADFAGLLDQIAGLTGSERQRALAKASERSRIALAHNEPCRLVLVGAQNAGKSTLFNQLLLRERVLTGSLPGLTRDPVSEVTTLAGYPFDVVDTAGVGVSRSTIDAHAVEAGRRLREGAILLLIVDASRGPGPEDLALHAAADRVLVIANKSDLPAGAWPSDLPCDLRACAVSDDAAQLRLRLGQLLLTLRALPPAGPVHGAAALDRDQFAALAALAGRDWP